MRPRKIVSLSCYSAQRRSELRVMLDVWGYCVIESDAGVVDAALVVSRFGVVLLNGCKLRDRVTPFELRDMLRVAAGRKRGPKKQGAPVVEPAIVVEAVTA